MARAERTRTNRSGRHLLRRATTGIVALALALTGLLVAPAAVVPAVAAEGLTEESHARFVVTAKGSVTAEVTTTITNVTPNSGSYVYYFDAYGIAVPTSATDVRATSGGASLTVRLEDEPEDPSIRWAVASFSPLNYGRTRTVEWTYEIEGSAFRSEDWARVGPGYATFAAQATGDDGRTSVEVVAPRRMDFDASVEFDTRRQGGKNVYTLDERTDEYGTWAAVSLRDPETSDTREVTVGDDVITLHSFRGDTTWQGFAAEHLEAGIPVLADLVGSEWPASVDVVRQDTSPGVLGYGGWFSEDERQIVVDESLDASLILHELTHAWLNYDTVDDRWLAEGLTEVVAHRAVAELGAEAEALERPSRKAKIAYPLADWAEAHTLDPEEEVYGYAAAYTATKQLTADLEGADFTALVAHVVEGASAYAAPDRPGQLKGTTDWRRFLDLLELHGASDGAEEVLRQWVLDADGKAMLDARAEAKGAYETLDETDGDWLPPLGLRAEMTRWDFDAARLNAEELGTAPQLAATIQQTAEREGLPVPAPVQRTYEDASRSTFEELATFLQDADTTITRVSQVSRSVAAASDPFTELGEALLDVETTAAQARAVLDDGEIDQAQALADDTAEQADRALWVGIGVVVGGLLLLTLLVLVPVLLVRRCRRRAAVLTEPQVVAVVAAPGAASGTASGAPDEPFGVSDDGADGARTPVGG